MTEQVHTLALLWGVTLHCTHLTGSRHSPTATLLSLETTLSPICSFLPITSISQETGVSLDVRCEVHCQCLLTSKYCRREGIWGTFKYSPPVMSQACKTYKRLSAKLALSFSRDVILTHNSSGLRKEDMTQQIKRMFSLSEWVRTRNSNYLSRCSNMLLTPLAHTFH